MLRLSLKSLERRAREAKERAEKSTPGEAEHGAWAVHHPDKRSAFADQVGPFTVELHAAEETNWKPPGKLPRAAQVRADIEMVVNARKDLLVLSEAVLAMAEELRQRRRSRPLRPTQLECVLGPGRGSRKKR